MTIFYSRKETEDNITIIYKYYPIWCYLMLFFIASIFILPQEASLYTPIIFGIITIIFAIDIWKPGREVKKAMKKGHVKMSGSKLSLSNPIKFVIEK